MREKCWSVVRDHTRNPGICPDQESNPRPSGLQEDLLPTELHWPGQLPVLNKVKFDKCLPHCNFSILFFWFLLQPIPSGEWPQRERRENWPARLFHSAKSWYAWQHFFFFLQLHLGVTGSVDNYVCSYYSYQFFCFKTKNKSPNLSLFFIAAVFVYYSIVLYEKRFHQPEEID